MQQKMHISSLKNKSAMNIKNAPLFEDKYHTTIKRAARILVRQNCGQFVYGGQYTSGNTFWLYDGIVKTIEAES